MKVVWRTDGKETFPPLIPKRELQATTYSYVSIMCYDVSLRKGSFAVQKKRFALYVAVYIMCYDVSLRKGSFAVQKKKRFALKIA